MISTTLKGALFSLLGFAFYSLMDGSVKYLTTFTSLNWKVLIFYVSIFILFFLFCIILFFKKNSFRIKSPFWVLIRASSGVFNLSVVFFILPKVHLDLFYSLVFISPIIASILASIFLGEHMNKHKLLTVSIGFIGILIITQPWNYFIAGKAFNAIELVPLLVALTDSITGVISRKYLIEENPITVVFYQFVLCTIVTGTISIYSLHSLPILHFNMIIPILITAVFTVGGYLCYFKAVQLAPIQIVLPMAYSQMVFGVIISIALFYEYPGVNTILGTIVIIIASLYMLFYSSRIKKTQYVLDA